MPLTNPQSKFSLNDNFSPKDLLPAVEGAPRQFDSRNRRSAIETAQLLPGLLPCIDQNAEEVSSGKVDVPHFLLSGKVVFPEEDFILVHVVDVSISW